MTTAIIGLGLLLIAAAIGSGLQAIARALENVRANVTFYGSGFSTSANAAGIITVRIEK